MSSQELNIRALPPPPIISLQKEANTTAPSHPPSPSKPKRDASALSPLNVPHFPSNAKKKTAQRKLTPKQLMKLKRSKERDEKKATKQKEQDLRASYTALTPIKTTADPSEREPTVGDKLIVRDEYNVKYERRHALSLLCCSG
jgi:hypothetical protein